MHIHDIRVTKNQETTELSGSVDDFHLFYRFPAAFELVPRGDAFLAAALLPAMRRGERLSIDPSAPVSPKLLEGTRTIQEVFVQWGPRFGCQFHRIEVQATVLPAPAGGERDISFFSGGVDGLYTFLSEQSNISHLFFAKGIDMQLSNDALFAECFDANDKFLRPLGKPLVPIETNVRFLGHTVGLGWELWNGAGLASIALAGGVRRCLIASSLTYGDMLPEGSNFVTDPLWSSERTTIVHHGANARRTEKLAKVAENDAALELLRVCWQDAGYNCGRCEKCLRTRIALRLLKTNAARFSALDNVRELKKLSCQTVYDHTLLMELLEVADRAGDHQVARALRRHTRRYVLRQSFINLDRTFLGGLCAAIRSRLRRRK